MNRLWNLIALTFKTKWNIIFAPGPLELDSQTQGYIFTFLFSAIRGTLLKRFEKQYSKVFLIFWVSSPAFDFRSHNFSKSSFYPSFQILQTYLCSRDHNRFQNSGFFLFFPTIAFYTVYTTITIQFKGLDDMKVPNPSKYKNWEPKVAPQSDDAPETQSFTILLLFCY